MSPQVATALISGTVALAVGVSTGLISWLQIRRERRRWIVDTKVAWSLELLKVRLQSYPAAFEALVPLSHGSGQPLTAERAGTVAANLNQWLYSAGGMCAGSTTRAAIIGLRQSCQEWSSSGGKRPKELYRFRNFAIEFLRLDLDLSGNEKWDFADPAGWLRQLGDDLEKVEGSRRPSERTPLTDDNLTFNYRGQRNERRR
jgi:hypothetical protein